MNQPSSVHRADFILTAAIALVALLVLGLVLVLGAGSRVYGDANIQREALRETRNALIAFTQEQTNAVSARRSYLIRGDEGLLARYDTAKNQARAHLEHVRTLAEIEQAATVSRLDDLTQQLFANLDQAAASRTVGRMRDARTAELTDAIGAEVAALHADVVLRSDATRLNEDIARRRIDSLAGVLAVLSLITSGLAILALRRERQQWLLATRAAEEARARAAASDLAKTRFLAVASHDMRQPLHALTLYLSALERRVESPEARDIITKMDRATQSMVGMFATLLDLARVQAGAANPEIEIVRLQDVIDRIVAEHPGSAIEAAHTPFAIRTDPILLERMLRNLVSNALKHGGGKARIVVARAGDLVELTVADDGQGIAPEDQVRIFDEFVRLEGRSEGLGLGLAIVKRIADLLKMPLELVSSPGAGARFTVRAPIVGVGDAPARTAGKTVALDGATVLVVDDEALAREAVARMLNDLGADVRSAAGEAEALAVLRDFTPTLLLMDLRIDGEFTGIDIARRLRAQLAPPPPVIVITGDTGPEALAQLRASGFAWLIKPVNERDLSEAAAEQLRGVVSLT